jgi:4'-phosphopantetheinyl transferase
MIRCKQPSSQDKMVVADFLWDTRPSEIKLSQGDVHVWSASLELEAPRLHRLQRTLSEDELSRAERFYFRKDREHFIAARGILRAILSLYLDRAPDQLPFCYGDRGKPALAITSGQEKLCFNLSHAQGLALYAIAMGREVGIDLEHSRPIPDAEQIAARFFSPRENAVFRALPSSDKQEAFFNCWTRKEAYIKAIGDGLARPLDRFEVSLRPGEPARLLSIEEDPLETRRWSLRELTPAPGFVAAIAVQGHGWQLVCWQWSDFLPQALN